MKIAIPSTEESILCPHFGHAPLFAVIELDIEKKAIISTSLLKPEMGGHAAVPPWLKTLGVSSLIAGGLGQLAIENLNNHGIEVFYGAPELHVNQVAELWMNDRLELNPQPCNHTHDHDCEHSEHTHG